MRNAGIRFGLLAGLLLVLVACGGSTAPQLTAAPTTAVPAVSVAPTPAEHAAVTPVSASAIPTTAPSITTTNALPPDGAWQVELTSDALVAAGWPADVTDRGTYTWGFATNRARLDLRAEDGSRLHCEADMEPVSKGFRLTYDIGLCNGQVDDISWRLDDDGLHLALITTSASVDQQKAYLETATWKSVDVGSVPPPSASQAPWLSRCEAYCHGPIASGTFTSDWFSPGLQMTFTDGSWFNTADIPDEIEFDKSSSALRFWQDPGASSADEELLENVPRTVDGLTDWFVSNPDMVVSDPEDITIGDGIAAKTFTFDVSDANVNDDPGCPVRSCLNVLWVNEGHIFGVGIGSGERLYLFNLGSGADARTVVVSLDTPPSQLDAMTAEVNAILETIRIED